VSPQRRDHVLDVYEPDTWVTWAMRTVARLWHLQGGACAICGKDMPARARPAKSSCLSLDHVWPRDRSRCRGLPAAPPGAGRHRRRTVAPGSGRWPWQTVAAHGRCNSAKGNRPPTGCELIWLMAVRARIEAAPNTWGLQPTIDREAA